MNAHICVSISFSNIRVSRLRWNYNSSWNFSLAVQRCMRPYVREYPQLLLFIRKCQLCWLRQRQNCAITWNEKKSPSAYQQSAEHTIRSPWMSELARQTILSYICFLYTLVKTKQSFFHINALPYNTFLSKYLKCFAFNPN